MKRISVLLSLFIILPIFARMTPSEALDALIKGNERFMAERSEHPNRMAERRKETAKMQEPFAIILGCSDSRVSPEILFDRGIGELFIVRVAGNVAGPLEMESIEYAADILKSSVLLVLGHERCGAITAVLAGQTEDIPTIASLVEPAVQKTENDKQNRLENTIQANVLLVVEQLKKHRALAPLIKNKTFQIVGGYYDLHTGKVEILTPR